MGAECREHTAFAEKVVSLSVTAFSSQQSPGLSLLLSLKSFKQFEASSLSHIP
jgi:hypothetical protein